MQIGTTTASVEDLRVAWQEYGKLYGPAGLEAATALKAQGAVYARGPSTSSDDSIRIDCDAVSA